MSGTHVIPTSDLDGRVARLDQGAKRILKFHSGSGESDRALLLETLENHYSQTPSEPVIHIHRKPPSRGRQGAMDSVRCGLCPESGKFQKVAGHIVTEHFKLSLWHCSVDSCNVSVSRKSDLDRHQYTAHKISRPREAKAERRSHVSSPVDLPSSPTTLSLSPRPGRTRSSRRGGGSRELPSPSSYSAIPTSADATSREDITDWHNDNAHPTNNQLHSPRMTRGCRRRLGFDPQVHSTEVLREIVSSTNCALSFPNDQSRLPDATYQCSSSSNLGTGGTYSDGTSLFQQGSAYLSLTPGLVRRPESAHSVDHSHPPTFLSPAACTPTTSSFQSGLSTFPALVHREASQMRPETVHVGMYHADNSTQRHFPSSVSNSLYSPINHSPQYFMTSNPITYPQHNCPPSAQIDMASVVPRVSLPNGQRGSTSSVSLSRRYAPHSVDEEFNSFGMPDVPFSRHSSTQ